MLQVAGEVAVCTTAFRRAPVQEHHLAKRGGAAELDTPADGISAADRALDQWMGGWAGAASQPPDTFRPSSKPKRR